MSGPHESWDDVNADRNLCLSKQHSAGVLLRNRDGRRKATPSAPGLRAPWSSRGAGRPENFGEGLTHLPGKRRTWAVDALPGFAASLSTE